MLTPGELPSGISIVIPAWNEEVRLATTLERLVPALELAGRTFEVIVVADGVRDHTVEVAERFTHRGVRVLAFPAKLGKGGAIKEGFQNSRYDRVGFIDADGPVAPGELLQMEEMLVDFDCVLGSRWTPGNRASRSFTRSTLSRLWNLGSRLVLALPVLDTQCGAKVFRRPVVLGVLKAVTVNNWAFDVDLLFHLHESGASIKEYAVQWNEGKGSKLTVVRAVPSMLFALIGIRVMNRSYGSQVPESWVRWFMTHWNRD